MTVSSFSPNLIQLLQCPTCRSPVSPAIPDQSAAKASRNDDSCIAALLPCTCRSYPLQDGIIDFLDDAAPMPDQTPQPEVTCLIMTLNEAGNIGQLISEVSRELSGLTLSYEILVIDGNSHDNTVDIARAAGATVIPQTSPGYAAGLKQGLAASNGQWILTLDGDLSHPANLIPSLLKKRHEHDIIVGSRWIAGGSFSGPLHRHLLSRLLNLIFRRALSLPVIDSSSGYRLYRRSLFKPADYSARDFSILEEILVKAVSDGYSIAEEPMTYQARKAGSSHARLAAFALSYLKTLGHLWLLRNDSGSADYDHRAYDSPNLVQRWWQRKRYKNIMSLLGPHAQTGAVLDVGCGSSRIIQSLPHAVALDLSPAKLRFLKRTNPQRIRASALALPFKDQSFDCLIHSQLIEHLPRSETAFSEMQRVLKPGGTLIVGTVDYASRFWPLIEEIYGILMPHAYKDEHITQYSEASLRETLQRHGLEPIDVRRIPGGEITIKALRK